MRPKEGRGVLPVGGPFHLYVAALFVVHRPPDLHIPQGSVDFARDNNAMMDKKPRDMHTACVVVWSAVALALRLGVPDMPLPQSLCRQPALIKPSAGLCARIAPE